MNVNAQDTINLISAGLKLGLKAYESAMRLSAAGYQVPGLEEFERSTKQLRNLPDLPTGNGGSSPLPAEAHA
ncbi:hypothetical protein [Halodesulfovibrio aestuarii]|uniref:Uncharacterized protein n=1 Tax=Halodesulfovibrio aestuarii TaxID=126333 RepID=A0A8G2FAC6_9BACT|nr:hypothetical protein [Halodesulfovibrio aestuarii]SHI82537.1 hypothetical protein SAMN05660830_01118 [Halodesulfovibrio aestuarii]